MVTHRRGPWSQNEDNWLISLVHRNGAHNWVRISQEIQTRSPKQCRERYHQNLKPSLNHDPITSEEGEQIERMVQEMGKRWAEIARRLKGRSDNAVKNWWNGGQNRRRRHPDRRDSRGHEAVHAAHAGFPYLRPLEHPQRYDEAAGYAAPQGLPPLFHRDGAEPPHYYAPSRQPSFNPALESPRSLKLPAPQPLELHLSRPLSAPRAHGFETPLPSPSCHSIVSTDGAPPSLITDSGSESRSPRGAVSPLDVTLAPLVGGRDERKNSATRFLPQSGFAVDDDDHHHAHLRSHSYHEARQRASVQLPPIQHGSAPAPSQMQEPARPPSLLFRESDYRASSSSLPSLTSQPQPQQQQQQQTSQPHPAPTSHQSVHHHTLPPPPKGQCPLPPFHGLVDPGSVPSAAAAAGPAKSAPASPKAKNRDRRMNLASMLS